MWNNQKEKKGVLVCRTEFGVKVRDVRDERTWDGHGFMLGDDVVYDVDERRTWRGEMRADG